MQLLILNRTRQSAITARAADEICHRKQSLRDSPGSLIAGRTAGGGAQLQSGPPKIAVRIGVVVGRSMIEQ